MHRADKQLANELELAFIASGLRPIQGTFRYKDNDDEGCLFAGYFKTCGYWDLKFWSKDYDEAKRLSALKPNVPIDTGPIFAGRSVLFANCVMWGFDDWGKDPNFIYDCVHNLHKTEDVNDISRGFRVGYELARRLFSEAPVERVPECAKHGVKVGSRPEAGVSGVRT